MKWIVGIILSMLITAIAVFAFIFLILAPELPPITAVTNYQPKIPLRIYTADQQLIGEFGEEHRDFVAIKNIPKDLKNAVLAIEDARFYEHGGIDYIGLARAGVSNLTGGMKQGASTITMQVARNFFLTREQTLTRKLREMLLASRIENALTKDQILQLYMNQIYLGQRSHGFSSAAQIYFGKSLSQLNLAEIAMLAGVPQNPARHNPVVNFDRTKKRQLLVLKNMLKHGYISQTQYQAASTEKIRVVKAMQFESHAAYVAEMVRQQIFDQYKEASYTMGIKVYTTINSKEQDAAYESVRRNIFNYDQRHGYRGPEAFVELPKNEGERDEVIDNFLENFPSSDRLIAGVVTDVSKNSVKADLATGESIEIKGNGLKWAARALQDKANRDLKIRPGALIRVMQDVQSKWFITQAPDVEAAYVSLDIHDGSYRALVGGFDFKRKQFNHVTSAWRQPGSSIKPFIFSAALERGFSPSTLINDVQLSTTSDEVLKWDPRNDDGRYDGPIEMQTALAQSKNVVAVRILRAVGVNDGHAYLSRFGFDLKKQPLNLTLALGTGAVTPAQLAGAYAVFANGGFQVKPWLIKKVIDAKGTILFEENNITVAQEDMRVIDQRNAFIVDSMMREVVRSGTGAMAKQKLTRQDIAGKTGTSSDAFDGWFAGYAGDVVAVAWMGFDKPKSLGSSEFGSSVALPIWIDAMREGLKGKSEVQRMVPNGVVRANDQIDGKWNYLEYENGAGVKYLDIDNIDYQPSESLNL
jgi:penicillin-binding protein 1A